VVGLVRRLLERAVGLQELLLSVLVLDGNRPGQVAVVLGRAQVKAVRRVVAEDVREDRVLHEVVEGTAGEFVKLHEVLEVAHLVVAPQAGGLVEGVGGCGPGQVPQLGGDEFGD